MTREELLHTLSNVENLLASSHYSLAAEQAKALLQHDALEHEPEVKIRALIVRIETFWHLGQRKEMLPLSEEALALAIEYGYRHLEARIKTKIGNLYTAFADYAHAIECFSEALAIEIELGNNDGIARCYGDIGIVYANTSDFGLALEYFNKSLSIEEVVGNKKNVAALCSNIGIVYQNLADYAQALEYFHKALAIDETLDSRRGIAIRLSNIGMIHHKLFDYDRALEYLERALEIAEEIGLKHVVSAVFGNMGNVYQRKHEPNKALEYYTHAYQTSEETGDKRNAAINLGNLGGVYAQLSDYDKAEDCYLRSIRIAEEVGDKRGIAIGTGSMGELYADASFRGFDIIKAEEYLCRAIELNNELGTRAKNIDYIERLARLCEEQERWKEANEYNKQLHRLENEIHSEEAKQRAERYDHERKAAEREKQRTIERVRYETAEQLLYNVLPPPIARQMMDGTTLIAQRLNNVSVLFADIVNFTQFSLTLRPEELVERLDIIFSEFDVLAEKFGLEKIKTIGDAYMIVAGAPEPREDHAAAMAQMAMEMLDAMKKFRIDSTGEVIQIRVGIHSGDVVAGVIGKKKFAYDLWGDAVNTAARMESHGEPGKIHVSADFIRELSIGNGQLIGEDVEQEHSLTIDNSPLTIIPRGRIEIKGKGTMKTYFLERA